LLKNDLQRNCRTVIEAERGSLNTELITEH
jgi:hypothetical protein